MTTKIKKVTKVKNVVIISTYKGKTVSHLKKIGEAYKHIFKGIEKAKVITTLPKAQLLRDKGSVTVVGNMIANFIAEAAEQVFEANASSYWALSDSERDELTVEQASEHLKFPKAYKVESLDVEGILNEGTEAEELF